MADAPPEAVQPSVETCIVGLQHTVGKFVAAVMSKSSDQVSARSLVNETMTSYNKAIAVAVADPDSPNAMDSLKQAISVLVDSQKKIQELIGVTS